MSDWKDKYRPKGYPHEDWPPLVYVGYADNEIAKLQAERDSLMNDMQRIYDSCSDVDLIIDIAGAAVEGNDE